METNTRKEESKMNTAILKEIRAILNSLARGAYQYHLVNGASRPSGADLKGAARKYSGRYARSRASIVARCNARLNWEYDGRFYIGVARPICGPHYYELCDDDTGESIRLFGF